MPIVVATPAGPRQISWIGVFLAAVHMVHFDVLRCPAKHADSWFRWAALRGIRPVTRGAVGDGLGLVPPAATHYRVPSVSQVVVLVFIFRGGDNVNDFVQLVHQIVVFFFAAIFRSSCEVGCLVQPSQSWSFSCWSSLIRVRSSDRPVCGFGCFICRIEFETPGGLIYPHCWLKASVWVFHELYLSPFCVASTYALICNFVGVAFIPWERPGQSGRPFPYGLPVACGPVPPRLEVSVLLQRRKDVTYRFEIFVCLRQWSSTSSACIAALLNSTAQSVLCELARVMSADVVGGYIPHRFAARFCPGSALPSRQSRLQRASRPGPGWS